MEIDPRLLDQIKEMDRTELNKKIEEISAILNVNPNLVKKLAGNPERIKRTIDSLNEKDLQKISKKIDPKKMQQIKDSFSSEGEQSHGHK